MESTLIIIVDDEPKALKYMQKALGDTYNVVACPSAGVALRLLQEQGTKVDLVVSDQRMPEMTGKQLLEIVASTWPHAGRILTTAYANVASLCECINTKAVDSVILKPWSPDDLRQTVFSTLSRNTRQVDRPNLRQLQTHLGITLAKIEMLLVVDEQSPSKPSTNVRHPSISGQSTQQRLVLYEEIMRLRAACEQIAVIAGESDRSARRKVCDLREVCDVAMRPLRDAVERSHDVAINVPKDTIVSGDGALLAVALRELVSNALFATRNTPNPMVALEAKFDGVKWCLKVIDNGDWPNAETIEGVFRDMGFDRVPESVLGLPIAFWHLIEGGGAISFSNNEWHGLTATIKFRAVLN